MLTRAMADRQRETGTVEEPPVAATKPQALRTPPGKVADARPRLPSGPDRQAATSTAYLRDLPRALVTYEEMVCRAVEQPVGDRLDVAEAGASLPLLPREERTGTASREEEQGAPEQVGEELEEPSAEAQGEEQAAEPEEEGEDEGEEEGQPGPEEGQDTQAAAAPTTGQRRRSREEREGEEALQLTPVPEPDTSPIALERRPLDMSAPDAPLVMPRYLRVEPKQGKAAVPPDLKAYEQRFRDAASTVEQLQRTYIDEGRAAADALVSLYAQIEDRAQRSLDCSIFGLSSTLREARSALALAEEDAIFRLALQAQNARKLIRSAARSALGTVAARKGVIEGRMSLAQDAALDIETMLALYASDVDVTGPLAAEAFSQIQADPSPAHVPNDAAPYEDYAPQMQDAENEPLDPAVQHRAGDRNTAFTEATSYFSGRLADAATQFQAAATAAFQPFQSYIDQLGTAAPRQIGTMRTNALKQVARTEKESGRAVRRSRNQIELSLVERYRQARQQVISTAVRAGRAQHDGIERAGSGQLQGYRAIASAQGGIITALEDQIGDERERTPEEFAKYVGQAARRTSDRAAETAQTRRALMAAAAAQMRRQASVRAEAGTASQDNTAWQLREQLSTSAERSGASLMAQILALEAGLRRLAEPIAASIDQFPIPAEAELDTMEEELWTKLTDARAQAVAAYNGGSGPQSEEREQSTETGEQPPAGTGSSPREFVEKSTALYGDPTTEEHIVSLTQTIAAGVVENVAWRGDGLIGQMTLLGQNPNETLNFVRGLTYTRGQAVIKYYNDETDSDLLDDVAYYMSFGNLVTGIGTRVHSADAVYNYLYGNRAAGALAEVQAATEWSNNADQVREAMTNLSPADMEAMRGLPGAEEVLNSVESDLEGADRRMFQILRNVTAENAVDSVAAARAVQLTAQVEEAFESDPEAGADNAFDIMERAAGEAGTSRLEGASEFGLTPDYDFESPEAAEVRSRESWENVASRLGNDGERWETGTQGTRDWLERTASRERVYTHNYVVVTTYERASIRPEQIRLLSNLAQFGPGAPQTRGAQLRVEETREGGAKPERLEHALDHPELNADMADPDRDTPETAADPAAAAVAARREQERLQRLERARQREDEMYRYYDAYRQGSETPDPNRSVTDIRAELGARLRANQSDERQGRLMEMQVRRGLTDPQTAALAFEHAVDRWGTDEDLLRRTFGRMSRDQIDAAVGRYDATHSQGLYDRLGIFEHSGESFRELSGDDRIGIQILAMGKPRNPRERAEVSRMGSHLQRTNAGWAGQLLAGAEHRRLVRSHDRLLQLMGVQDTDFDARGRLRVRGPNGERLAVGHFNERGEFVPSEGQSAIEFTMMLTHNERTAEAYKQATDNIANAITTALVVAAAVISTIATGGAAASIWIPVLVTAGAGLLGMAASYAIKGGRYGYEDAGRDLGMTIVQAATAGIGAGLTIARAGGTAALRAAMVSRMVSNQGFRALTVFDEAIIAGASGTIGSGGAALFDDRAWDRGEWLSNIGHGMTRGFVGGFAGGVVTAGATRAVSGLAGGIGRASGAVTAAARGRGSDVGSRLGRLRGEAYARAFPTTLAGRTIGGGLGGAATRAVEIDYDRRRGVYRGSRAQAWEEIADAARQNAIQSYLEGVGERMSDNSASMRAWRDSMMRGRAPPTELPPAVRPPPDIEEAAGRRPTRPDELPAREPVSPARPPAEERGPRVRPVAGAEAEADASPAARRPLDGEGAAPRLDEIDFDVPIAARTADDRDADTRLLRAANDNPGAPVHVRVALADTDLVVMGRVAEGSVLVHPDSRSLHAANDNFGRLINADPGREAAVYHNPVTGEYVVIQGNSVSVASVRPGGELEGPGALGRLITRGGMPDPSGHWILRTHYHPNRPGEAGTRLLRRLPSGADGDFAVIFREARSHSYDERTSRIYFIDNGRVSYTDFGFNATREGGRFWIDFPDPATGVRTRRDFATIGDYHMFLGGVRSEAAAAGGSKTTVRTADEGGGPEPVRRIGGEAPSIDDRLTVRNLEDVGEVAARMQQVADFEAQIAGRTPRGDPDPDLARRTSLEDAMAAVTRMGLVDRPDAAIRLTALLNDPAVPDAIKPLVARAVLEATRESMLRTGKLDPGDELLMFFRGASSERLEDYRRRGIDPTLAKAREEDVGPGLYMSQDLESARQYGGDASAILPFIVRRSDLGNVFDISPGSPLRARWEQFVAQNWMRFGVHGVTAKLLGRPGPMDPRQFGFFWFERAGRVVLFDAFRQAIAADPNVDPATRRAAADPDIVLTDLGGPVTYGNDRGFMTDQAAIKTQRVADLMNEQLGFPRVGATEAEMLSGRGPARTADSDEAAPARKRPPQVRRVDPSVAELERMLAVLGDADPRGPKALIERIRAGGVDAAEAQRLLNEMSKSPAEADVVNITQAEMEAKLPRPDGKFHEATVTVQGLTMRVYRPSHKQGEPVPQVRFEATIPPREKGHKPVVWQFGDGELRVWRLEPTIEHPAGILTQESIVGPRRERLGYEDQIYAQGEGEFVGSPLERAHLHGAGRGVESPFGIGLAPREVNQYLQARGIEAFMSRLRDALKEFPGIELMYETNVAFHPGTSRQARIGYRLDVVVQGRRIEFAEFAINIETDRPGTKRKARKGTTGIWAEPLQWRDTGRDDYAGRLLSHIREAGDVPRVLLYGEPRRRPGYLQVMRQLAEMEPETIEKARNLKSNEGRLQTHSPPLDGLFDIDQWGRDLLSKLRGDNTPVFLVIDLRGRNLSEAQKRKIARIVATLPKEDWHKIIWLE